MYTTQDSQTIDSQGDVSTYDSDVGDWDDDGWSVSPTEEEVQKTELGRDSKPMSAASFFDETTGWGSSQDDWASDWSHPRPQQSVHGKAQKQTLPVTTSAAGFIKGW